MVKTIILHSNLNHYDMRLFSKKIEEKEAEGYTVVDTKTTSGNNFSKYTASANIVVVMTKKVEQV